MNTVKRKLNAFENLLFWTGIAIGVSGFVFINFIYRADGSQMTWSMLTVVFLWLILILMVICAAVLENMREELTLILNKHGEETRLLRRITHELHEEIRLMRIDVSYTHNRIVDSHEQLVGLHGSTNKSVSSKPAVTKKTTKKAVKKVAKKSTKKTAKSVKKTSRKSPAKKTTKKRTRK